MATAHADDAGELLSLAGSDLTQATQVLDQIASTALDAKQAFLLTDQLNIQTGPESGLLGALETYQAGLPSADETSPLLLGADQQLLQAATQLLDADQGFLAAAQAGELTNDATGFSADLSLLDADLGLLGADVNVVLTDTVAMLDPGILTAF
jgi:hypothetical protein